MTVQDVLLVHGAWHGSWCWERLSPILRSSGLTVHTVDLPSTGPDDAELGGLYDDAAAVRERIRDISNPVLVVGHSYGGQVITEGADEPNVSGLVYVAAFMLDVGQSLADSTDGSIPEWQALAESGTAVVVPDPGIVFYADCDTQDAARASARLTAQSLMCGAQPLRSASWRRIPSTYIMCTQDRAVPPAAQEAMSAHATRVERLEAGHSPFLSMPADLATIIVSDASTRR